MEIVQEDKIICAIHLIIKHVVFCDREISSIDALLNIKGWSACRADAIMYQYLLGAMIWHLFTTGN